MSLEEELVNNILKEGKTEKDVLETCKDLVEKGFLNLNPKKVETSLRRYELIQKYNSISRIGRKKEIRKKFKEICKSKIEEVLGENPSIISARIKVIYRGNYCNCNKIKITYIVESKRIKEEGGIFSSFKEKSDAFNYCHHCGRAE
jgi:hypothetical protein